MAIKKYKPVTPGQRNKAISSFEEITAKKPYKKLLVPLKRTGGRNNTGQMTVRYIGGGHKRMYRLIDFLRNKDNVKATVLTIEYDPNLLFPSVRSSTRSSSVPARVPLWPVPPVRLPSSPPVKATTQSCACPPARPAWSLWPAAPPSAPFPTRITTSSPPARPAAPAGWAAARTTGVS